MKKINDGKFGETTILENINTHEEVLLREIHSTDEEDYNKNIKKFTERKQLEHENVIKLIGTLRV